MCDDCWVTSANFSPAFTPTLVGCWVMWYVLSCWDASVLKNKMSPPMSRRQSGDQSVGAHLDWMTMRKPNTGFLVNTRVVRVSVCLCVWAQPGNFLLCESLPWTHPQSVEVVVMHMSDLSFVAAFDWRWGFWNDATNFPPVLIWVWFDQIVLLIQKRWCAVDIDTQMSTFSTEQIF